MKPEVLITRELLPEAMEFLRGQVSIEVGASDRNLTHAELLAKAADKKGLLTMLTDVVDREVIDTAPGLKIIANCAVGYNNIDLGHARLKGILVTNTPGVLTETTAELTLALILAVLRRIPQAERLTRAGGFKGWALDFWLGKDLSGARLGILGFGRIGRAVACRASAFGAEILYYDPVRLMPNLEKFYKASYLPLDDLLKTVDILSIHADLTPQTHHLISRERLSLMKRDAILINVARGPIVDEKALAETLAAGKLWGAGLDVYEREPEIEGQLLTLDNVVLLPHIGSATYATRLRMAMTAARNLVQGMHGERPDNLIEPAGELPRN
jgi:glyoxylate reductase